MKIVCRRDGWKFYREISESYGNVFMAEKDGVLFQTFDRKIERNFIDAWLMGDINATLFMQEFVDCNFITGKANTLFGL